MDKDQYLLGKVVGIFLYNGFLVRNSVGIHIKGYGQDFTVEVCNTLNTFIKLQEYSSSVITGGDSTQTYYIKDKKFQEYMKTLLGVENKYEDTYKVDNIVEYASRSEEFKQGLMEMFEKDDQFEFRDGTKLSYEEETKIWEMV